MQSKSWRRYEEVAQYILNELASEFGLGRVEGKQILAGLTGTNWELDAKGVCIDGKGVVLIECRRYTNSRIRQKDMASIAFQISDIGAVGGITVSPMPPQYGAQIIASKCNITHVELSSSSTTTDYIVSFLDKVFIKFTEHVQIGDHFEIEIIPKDSA